VKPFRPPIRNDTKKIGKSSQSQVQVLSFKDRQAGK